MTIVEATDRPHGDFEYWALTEDRIAVVRSSLKTPYAHSLVRLGDWPEKSASWATVIRQIVEKYFLGLIMPGSLFNILTSQLWSNSRVDRGGVYGGKCP